MYLFSEGFFRQIVPTGAMDVATYIIAAVAAVAVGLTLDKLVHAFAAYKAGKKGMSTVPGPRNIWGVPREKSAGRKAGYIGLFLVFFLTAAAFVEPVTMIFLWFFSVVAVVGSEMDNRMNIIPNELMLGTFAAALLFRLLTGGWKDGLLALASSVGIGVLFLITLAVFKAITGKIGMRAGDLKLLMVLGAVCGYTQAVGFSVMAAAFMGLAVSVVAFAVIGLVSRRLTLGTYFPFCTFGMIGLLTGLYYPVLLLAVS